ncbi:uncharacterized protein LOC112596271 [Melanaphis sacchari]|uniref:Myosin-M heavy chain n=1 Tax=Melanaphis sacchari TaxID=742174 RepID=A0A2H8TGD0_9HEMI|nr:uncharacterized protein LOC112596271 [Melanaphis sacchari]XP_025197587.1 uncharacterized protein LOC112596271 [Melanaphis sacchari]XP_025197588.1 uncharacterized protein LOC112596271 [Melanaphis sacchari]XP_025197589.1 uncharacterized protein LOC112596271 [Melanaphis sacchari]
MNSNRLRGQHSIATVRDRRPAATATATLLTQCRRTNFGIGVGCGDAARLRTDGGRSVFRNGVVGADNELSNDAMAASVALPERYRQPTATIPAASHHQAKAMATDGDRSQHRRHYQNGYRPHHAKYNSVSAGSALSKSMRYADGWLYERDAGGGGGTVGRHSAAGGRNKSRSTFLDRDHFGTVAAAAVAAAAAAATVVAPPSEDPYERVRRNRMANTVTAIGKLDRKRNRSGSPRTPSPDYDDTGSGNSVVSSSRRSILECNVNPYDLLQQTSDNDDDDNDVDGDSPKRMSLKDKFMNRIQDTVFNKNKSSIGGFGSFSSKKPVLDRNTDGGVNIAGHTVRLFNGNKSPATHENASSVWYDDGSSTDVAATVAVETDQSPVRPPRRRCKPTTGFHLSTGPAKRSHSLTTCGTTTVSAEIKSILKKPASLTTDDLSPVRSRTPVSASSVIVNGVSPCNGLQRKMKKQVQFDIVSVTVEKSSKDDGRHSKTAALPGTENRVEHTPLTTPTPPTISSTHHLQHRKDQDPSCSGPDAIVAAVERKLKRSLSDRQNSGNAIGSDDVTVFNDTMRIHVRHKSRPDSRVMFERPAEPPPPPPPPPPSASTPTITELFLCGNRTGYSSVDNDDNNNDNRTVVQVSPSDELRKCPEYPVEPEQKTSILINSSPGLKTSVIIGEGGAAYAASFDNKVTISIGPTGSTGRGNKCGNYKSNVTVVDRAGSRMSDFIRMNYDPVQAAHLDVTPHVCGRRSGSGGTTPLVSPYRVSEIEKHHTAVHPMSDTESSSESCYASAKEDASYSSASSASTSSFSSTSSSATAAAMAPDSEPIYEEISESPTPPPLPSCPPPDRADHEPATALPCRSIFEGATKYDIINYLVDAKRRCGSLHDTSACHPKFVVVTDEQAAGESDVCSGSTFNDSGEESPSYSGCGPAMTAMLQSADPAKKAVVDIERNDSGVGSETSQSSRSKWQQQQQQQPHETQHSCEDCDQPVEIQTTDSGIMFAPLVCRKCHKRRAERREIIAEIVETEEKYGRDLDIITEEFYRPMMVAGLLNADQLTTVFLNVSELKEHSAALSQKLRDAYEIAVEQGDDDLLTVNIGRLFLEASPSMLHAFQSYCTRQGNAALLLANLEKEKELLRIFLRVSQMENAVLRRMNLNSFLMVPVQRVTKYPLLLARLYKVTPEHHLEARQTLNEARHKIQLHLEHINSLAKDISSTKLWRKIYAINGKRSDNEDLADIKFRKVAVDVLEWSGLGEEIRFAMEGRLLYTQPSDHNWRRGGRTIKLMPINAIIVTLGKPNDNYNPDADNITFPRQNGIKDASLVLLKEKSGRISLLREPMYLDRCVLCCESDWDDYFELHEITTKDTYILKGQDGEQTKMWYKQLQYHCQTLGCWRKRRNALANIMINKN